MIEARIEEGKPVAASDEPPERPDAITELVLSLFGQLDTCRPPTQGAAMGRIPVTAMYELLALRGIPSWLWGDVVSWLMAADDAALPIREKRLEALIEASKSKHGKRDGRGAIGRGGRGRVVEEA